MARRLLILFLILLAVGTAEADERNLFLHRSFETSGSPEAASLVVIFDTGDAAQVSALVLPPLANSDGGNNGAWQIGALVSVPPRAQELTVSVILEMKDASLAALPPVTMKVSDPTLFDGSVELLRSHLLKRKEEARSWALQIEQQEVSLRRLRSDAEIVGNLGRIVEARQEESELRQHIDNLMQDKKNLDALVRLARTRPAPKNMIGRERQLARQVSELTEIAKTTEGSEVDRRQAAEKMLQAKLAMLEETRSLDPDSLQRELIRLRKRRRDLEVGVVARAPQ